MMMDPVSVLSFAVNIFQVIDYGVKVTDIVLRARKQQSIALALEDANGKLKSTLDSLAQRQSVLENDVADEDERNLALLAQKTADSAKSLSRTLSDLSIPPSGPGRKRKTIRLTALLVFRPSSLERGRAELEEYRQTLNTSLLVNLMKKYDLDRLKQSELFDHLDAEVQDLAFRVSQTMREESTKQGEKTRAFLGHDLAKLNLSLEQIFETKEFLKSLFFPEIHLRLNSIGDAYPESYQWMYKAPENQQNDKSQVCFADWTRTDDDVFWISGKAGAGKSCLTKFVLQEYRTTNGLKQWANDQTLIVTSFFFWASGSSSLQSSLEGLLRSLLFQLLSKHPHYITKLGIDTTYGNHAWTLNSLKTTLLTVLDLLEDARCRLCFFIDGLDECFGNEINALVNLLLRVSSKPNVKMVVSSRPWQVLSQKLSKYPGLFLDRFNHHDIEMYVRETIVDAQETFGREHISVDVLIQKICERSEGVFLWAVLTTQSILRGIHNCDDVSELQQRIDEQPKELEAIYSKMLNDIEPLYHDQAAKLFELLVLRPGERLLWFALALCDVTTPVSETITFNTHESRTVLEYSFNIATRLLGRFYGFVELHLHHEERPFEWLKKPISKTQLTRFTELEELFSECLHHSGLEWYNVHVQLPHRTIRDFLSNLYQSKDKIKLASPCWKASSRIAAAAADIRFLQLELSLRPSSMFSYNSEKALLVHFNGFLESIKHISPVNFEQLILILLDADATGCVWFNIHTLPRQNRNGIRRLLHDSSSADHYAYAPGADIQRACAFVGLPWSLVSRISETKPAKLNELLFYTIWGLEPFLGSLSGRHEGNIKLLEELFLAGANPNDLVFWYDTGVDGVDFNQQDFQCRLSQYAGCPFEARQGAVSAWTELADIFFRRCCYDSAFSGHPWSFFQRLLEMFIQNGADLNLNIKCPDIFVLLREDEMIDICNRGIFCNFEANTNIFMSLKNGKRLSVPGDSLKISAITIETIVDQLHKPRLADIWETGLQPLLKPAEQDLDGNRQTTVGWYTFLREEFEDTLEESLLSRVYDIPTGYLRYGEAARLFKEFIAGLSSSRLGACHGTVFTSSSRVYRQICNQCSL